jgi:peroxiredoxin
MRTIHSLFAATLLGCFLFTPPALAATIRATLKSPSARAEASAFRLADASGTIRQLADYRGKVVLLNFWATDCGGCRIEIPWLVDIEQAFRTKAFRTKSVAVIGISMDISYEDLKNATEAWAKVKPFVASHQIAYPILMAEAATLKGYDLQALPVSYLIDTHGRIAATYVGLIDKENVKANIDALLAETSAWRFRKDDPLSKKKSVEIEAASFQPLANGEAKLLHQVTARLYDGTGSYQQISSQEAIVDQRSGTLLYGPHLDKSLRLSTRE